jgi:predicted metal-binding transcription factor (methanogenesis marker protein 9)
MLLKSPANIVFSPIKGCFNPPSIKPEKIFHCYSQANLSLFDLITVKRQSGKIATMLNMLKKFCFCKLYECPGDVACRLFCFTALACLAFIVMTQFYWCYLFLSR